MHTSCDAYKILKKEVDLLEETLRFIKVKTNKVTRLYVLIENEYLKRKEILDKFMKRTGIEEKSIMHQNHLNGVGEITEMLNQVKEGCNPCEPVKSAENVK